MSALQDFPRITPFLWFDSNAEEAVDFYISVFKNSRRLDELRTAGDSEGRQGHILTIAFEVDGQKFTAAQRRPDIQIHRSGLVYRPVRFAAGSGSLLVEALRRRQ
jgi:predicted 3-demethylubiquinone-9 3-methyltransferase (glyoxalase superfamily)